MTSQAILDRIEDFTTEQCIMELRVDALEIVVFPRTLGLNPRSFGADNRDPTLLCRCDKLRAIVGQCLGWRIPSNENFRMDASHRRPPEPAINADEKTYSHDFIDEVEYAIAVMHRVVDEVG